MPRILYDFDGDSSGAVHALDEIIAANRRTLAATRATQYAIDDFEVTTKKATKSVDKMSTALGATKNAALSVGGEVGALGGRIENAARAASGLYKSVGLAGIGVGSLVVGVTAALGVSAKWSLELQENVDKLDKLALATGEQKAAADRITVALEEQDTAWTQLKTTIGTAFEPVLTGTLGVITSTTDGITWLSNSVLGLSRSVFELEKSGALAIWNTFFGPGPKVRSAAGPAPKRMGDTGRALLAGLTQEDGGGGFTKEQAGVVFEAPVSPPPDNSKAAAAAAKQAADEAEAARKRAIDDIEAQLKASADLAEVTQAAFRASLEGEEALTVAHADRMAAIDALEAASQDHAAAEAARAAEQMRYEKELGDLRAEEAKKRLEAEEEFAEKVAAATEGLHDQEQRFAAAADELQAKRLDAALTGFNQIGDATQTIGNLIAKNAKYATEEEQKKIKAMFRGMQALGLAQVAINTAVAIARAPADLGPIAGALAVAGLIASGAAQAATIAAQQPPEFPGGGVVTADVLAVTSRSPDHGLLGASPGEGVVNRGGMADLGEDGLRAINQRRGLGGPVVIQQVYGHRVFDTFVQDNLRRGGPLKSAISTRKPGHSGRG